MLCFLCFFIDLVRCASFAKTVIYGNLHFKNKLDILIFFVWFCFLHSENPAGGNNVCRITLRQLCGGKPCRTEKQNVTVIAQPI